MDRQERWVLLPWHNCPFSVDVVVLGPKGTLESVERQASQIVYFSPYILMGLCGSYLPRHNATAEKQTSLYVAIDIPSTPPLDSIYVIQGRVCSLGGSL